jgi:GntR family transcriptional repressor for pyruvate dehydrogenase complex
MTGQGNPVTNSAKSADTESGFRSIQRVPAAAGEVISNIKQMILDGKLVPFQRLPSEKDLAEALGVSRPTVREAVRGLTTLNIVESRQGDGTYVTSLEPMLLAAPIDFLLRVDEGALGALTDARIVLESGIAQLAASRVTPEGIGRLETLIADYADCIDDIPRCIELDLAFHQELAVVADSPILSSLVTTLAALGLQSRTQTAHDVKARAAANGEHAAIAKAVAAGDAAAARAAMVSHLSHVQESVALELAADRSARQAGQTDPDGGAGQIVAAATAG